LRHSDPDSGYGPKAATTEDAVADAKRKFAKQQPAGGIVFINLTGLSSAETLVEDEIERDYAAWADGVERDDLSIQIVSCAARNGAHPSANR